MIQALTLIFMCQLAGELVAGTFALPIPGPVLGMVLLLALLLMRGGGVEQLDQTANGLLKSMSLLFVPAGTGVMMHANLLGQALLPLGAALVVSTLATITVTALLMAFLNREGSDA